MPKCPIFARRFGVTLVTAVMGVLATGSLPPTIAQEPAVRNGNPLVAVDVPVSNGNPLVAVDVLLPRATAAALPEASINAAIQTMLCLEARAAINVGQLDETGRQWVVAHGHHCRDERLLFDALGF